MANKESIFDRPFFRIVLTILSAVLSTLALAFSSLTILKIYEETFEQASAYLLWVYVSVGFLSLVSILRNRNKINIIRSSVLFIFNISLGIISIFAKDNYFLFSLTGGLYCVTIVVSRIFNIIQNHSLRSILLNGVIVAFAVALAIGLLTSPIKETADVKGIVSVECVFIAIVSFLEAARIVFSQLKVKVLFRIIVSTFSLEILFGLLTMIICFSIVIYSVEDPATSGITNFPDALWYCFAVVTTIGFGDMVAKTLIGRILTVILGLYGLIVVAVITSIIVNFYNETSGKQDQKEFKEISKKHDKDNQ